MFLSQLLTDLNQSLFFPLLLALTVILFILWVIKIYIINGRSVHPNLLQSCHMTNKICIITGASVGALGYEAAKQLAKLGATVVLIVYNMQIGNDVTAKLKDELGEVKVEYLVADLSELEQVRQVACKIRSKFGRVDILINCAATMMCPHALTRDGIEIQFAVNYLSHFLLTMLLKDLVMKCQGRVINFSSNAFKYLNQSENDLFCSFTEASVRDNGRDVASPFSHYARSKLAIQLSTKHLSQMKFTENGNSLNIYSLHPGATRTTFVLPFIKNHPFIHKYVYGPLSYYFMRSPFQGIQTCLHLTLSPLEELENGEFYVDCQVEKKEQPHCEKKVQKQLFETSMNLCSSILQVV
ncbi:hypothetical protein C9374_013859 [Naegleria lovaniensis]|uniref:Uncharacterized protein n=1 Tax=Naegleria lovaniensis TaxID=51637 RepID=A0AA88H108_NAELO|nr:uncharacterized protein C9374_013859 [Naegleria lovaniensis]KAG2389299.1 hypothetical protein C9374_013859 [Naegleria lovaniensis]